MLKSVIAALVVAMTAFATPNTVSAQMADFQPVALTNTSATGALDAMAAVFAVANNYDGQGVGGDLDSLMSGFAGLTTYADAQAQLGNAVGAYGFSSYAEWVATIQTVFGTYAYIQSAGAMAQMGPAVDAAMQQVLADPNIPEAQKQAIIAQLGAAGAAQSQAQANAPSPENQAIVTELLPLVEYTMQSMQAMQ